MKRESCVLNLLYRKETSVFYVIAM